MSQHSSDSEVDPDFILVSESDSESEELIISIKQDEFKPRINVNEIWKEMNMPMIPRPINTVIDQEESIEKPLIVEFAGEFTVSNQSKDSNKKRKFLDVTLLQIAKNHGVKTNVTKLSVLSKSKADWNKFVTDAGIEGELKFKNKDGYVEKVAFLKRTEARRDVIYKEGTKYRKPRAKK